MIRPERRLQALVFAIGLAVFLFACGSREGGSASPSEAGVATPGPDSDTTAGGDQATAGTPAAAVASTQSPAPGSPAADSPAGQAAPPAGVTFGSVPESTIDQEALARETKAALEQRARIQAGASQGRAFSNKDLEAYRDMKKDFGFKDDTVTVDLS